MSRDIPKDAEDVGAGSQAPAGADSTQLTTPPKPPYANVELVDTLAGIASTNPRMFGSGVSASMAVGLLREARDDVTGVRRDLATAKEALEKANIEKARLRERVDSLGRLKTFRNIAQSIGAALVGVSVKLLDNHESLGWGVALLAVVLIISSWFYEPKQTP